jgi:hypothetical protein
MGKTGMTKSFDNLIVTIMRIKAQSDQHPQHPSCRLEGNLVSLKELGRAFLSECRSELEPSKAFVNGQYPKMIVGIPMIENPEIPHHQIWVVDCNNKVVQRFSIESYLQVNQT